MSNALPDPPADPPPNKPPASPLASPEPWDLVRDGYVEELWEDFSKFSRSALELAKLPPKSDVLDVCAGPGTLVVQAAKVGRRVVGVDFSPRMLEELRRRAGDAGLTNVEALEADGQNLPFPDASFDGAFSMFGLIFFPDRARGFKELYRVLRPGGRAVVASWRPFVHIPPIKAAFDTLIELMPELPFGKSKAPLGEPEEVRAEFGAAGFTDVEVEVVTHASTAPDPGTFWQSMARSSAPFVLLRRRLGDERWAALSDSIRSALVAKFGPGPLEVAPQALIGLGTRP